MRKSKEVKNAYNKVSADLRSGLSALQNSSGSSFSFKDVEDERGLHIETNIPDSGEKGTDTISIDIDRSGGVKVNGAAYFVNDPWAGLGGYSTQQFSSSRGSAAKKAIKHIKKKAKERGLIL